MSFKPLQDATGYIYEKVERAIWFLQIILNR